MIGAVAAAALFGGLVHAVLVAAHVSEPAATTVYGFTLRRLWATTVVVLALGGVSIGGLALARPANRLGTASGRLETSGVTTPTPTEKKVYRLHLRTKRTSGVR